MSEPERIKRGWAQIAVQHGHGYTVEIYENGLDQPETFYGGDGKGSPPAFGTGDLDEPALERRARKQAREVLKVLGIEGPVLPDGWDGAKYAAILTTRDVNGVEIRPCFLRYERVVRIEQDLIITELINFDKVTYQYRRKDGLRCNDLGTFETDQWVAGIKASPSSEEEMSKGYTERHIDWGKDVTDT